MARVAAVVFRARVVTRAAVVSVQELAGWQGRLALVAQSLLALADSVAVAVPERSFQNVSKS